MKLGIKLKQEIDEYEDIITYQELEDKENGISFEVHNLNWDPEDAYIERELFSAQDYINALNKGIELAKKGYTSVVIEDK